MLLSALRHEALPLALHCYDQFFYHRNNLLAREHESHLNDHESRVKELLLAVRVTSLHSSGGILSLRKTRDNVINS